MALKNDIKAEAFRLGFTLVGVTRPDPPDQFPVYEYWLAQGRHAGMSYLATQRARERRADPRIILPESGSILVLGIRYPDPRQAGAISAHTPNGRVASYAWGEDYHEVLLPRLHELAKMLKNQTKLPVQYRAYTDTGPVMERSLAQRSGLGWIGKNTCLINPRSGSYYLLSEILLNVELEPDISIRTDHCGTCRRCIDACPTNCILEDRTIDANRCISYLTIENKGYIPQDLREKMGAWVFGCDICQMICPWNVRFSLPEHDLAFQPRLEVALPNLRAELHLTAQEFNRKFKHSPIQRTRRRGYLRNVAVAIGNFKDPASVQDLVKVMQAESEPLVRGHAAWALGQMNTSQARSALYLTHLHDPDEFVRQEASEALDRKL